MYSGTADEARRFRDIYFGPKAPATGESNWAPTDPKGRFEVLARFYGAQKALFEKTWKLADIEKI